MKNYFTTKRSEEKKKNLSFSNERRKQAMFTPGFFKYLLGFTLIIAASFAVLVYFGLTGTST